MDTKSSINISHINLMVALFAVIAPGAYIIGMNWASGYYSAFGVSSSVFTMSIQETYLTAYYAATLFLIAIVNPLCEYIALIIDGSLAFEAALVFISIVTLFYSATKASKYLSKIGSTSLPVRVLLWLFSRKEDLLNATESSLHVVLKASILVYLFLLFFLCWCLAPVMAYRHSASLAESKIAAYEEKGCASSTTGVWSRCVTLFDGKTEVATGLLVSVNNTKIALYNGKYSTIIALPKNYSIRKQLVSNKGDSIVTRSNSIRAW